MRVVFMGTPAFAVPSLEALLAAGHEVAAVFTQPDRPAGRGNRLQASPVKQLALQHGIPVYQPVKIRRESVEDLRALAPEVCVTAAFGQILSQELLDIPRRGTVNVHASLLPRHRGSAPIAWAILQGDARVGVTTMLTDKGIDTGAMLLRRETDRLPEETCGELTERLARVGAELLVETLAAMAAGTLTPVPQDEAAMTYEPMLTKEMGTVDWQESARRVADRILALNPWPCCAAETDAGRLKLLRARPVAGEGTPGAVLAADAKQGLVIACGTGAVEITQLQAPGGKAMAAKDFLRGHAVREVLNQAQG
ncbi:MAG: methionyl-tRNA formyltransferase [Clostridia bacterium]|nr:methionyl-tRNA formyltransferase [Clostridia bacterium]